MNHESPSLTPTKKHYDTSTADGMSAKTLLDRWAQETSAALPAPWRMTAGSGGSEFGKLEWFLLLCRAFKKEPSAPGEFKLWQLALADVTVRYIRDGAAALFVPSVTLYLTHRRYLSCLHRRRRRSSSRPPIPRQLARRRAKAPSARLLSQRTQRRA